MINTEKITEAILSTGVSPLAIESGAELAQAWIDDEAAFADEIIAVETGFSIRLNENTWIIGVQDLICADALGIYGREHKTTAAPSRYWTEDKWLESIKTGPQIGVYALALNRGVFYENGTPFVLRVPTPVREYVRAAVKSSPPRFWPTDPRDSWRVFDDAELQRITDAFIVKAAGVRASRKTGLVPFQLPGRQCTDFNRLCGYYDECTGGRVPPTQTTTFDQSDPAAHHALPFLPDEARGPDAVILSASSYATWTRCMELARRDSMGGGKEESIALSTGTVFHAGVACFYKLLKEQQDTNKLAAEVRD